MSEHSFYQDFQHERKFLPNPYKNFPLEPVLLVFSGGLDNSVLCLAFGAIPSEKDRLHIYNNNALWFQPIAL